MPRDIVPAREGPRKEISHTVEPHNRPWSPPKPSVAVPRGTKTELAAKDFKMAVDKLALLNPASAVEYMRELPTGLLEMFLLAEEVGQGRDYILRAFPKPGQRARDRYLAVTA